VLTVLAGGAESLWDEALPVEVKELPEDLAALDGLLADPELLWPLVEALAGVRAGRAGGVVRGPADDRDGDLCPVDGAQGAVSVGESDVGGGGVGLDSSAPVLSDFAVRAGARRVHGAQADQADRPETVSELSRALIVQATREKRFRAAGDEDRLDGDQGRCEVSDRCGAGLGRGQDARARGPQARQAGQGEPAAGAGSMGRKLRAITRTIRRRTGEAKAEVLALTAETGELLQRSITETRRLAVVARRKARGRGAKAKLKAAAGLEELADRCEKVASQIKQRVAGEPIKDRLVSIFDPDARPIRKGKLGKPNEFGYVTQLAEVTENTRRGARGLILPASTTLGNPADNTLLPGIVAELGRLGISPWEVALDGGFMAGPTSEQLGELAKALPTREGVTLSV